MPPLRQWDAKALAGPREGGEAAGQAAAQEVKQVSAAQERTRALEQDLRARVADEANLVEALQRVCANKGSAGIDRMTVAELKTWFSQRINREKLKEQLLSGTYEPALVRGVQIPKPGGQGVRQLGIPTVVDRLVVWARRPRLGTIRTSKLPELLLRRFCVDGLSKLGCTPAMMISRQLFACKRNPNWSSRHSPRRPLLFCLVLSFIIMAALAARADVVLHGLFSDHMVLQANARVPIWGWAEDGEEVTVEYRDQIVRTTAKDGKWLVELKKLKPAGPNPLKITGKNSITLHDVLVGEVWVASGQSNMEWPLRASYEPETEIPKTQNSMVRLYTVPKLKAGRPTNNVNGSWVECKPSTTSNFSAVAYYFARDLQKALGVPVGIIHTSWGGSPAEVWMSEEALASNPGYKRDILEGYAAQRERYETALAKFEKDQAEAKKVGAAPLARRPNAPWRPSELYNGMIAPLLPYAIAGAIWYQGESNAGRAWQYRTLFPDMIRNWRKDWDQGNFPFLAVQLAPFMAIKDQPAESSWAELREAQLLATKTLPKVGLAVITDVGDEKDIHPKKKEPVGARLALAARAIAYGQDVVYSGPVYRSMKTRGEQVVLTFEQTGGGLMAKNGELKGFAIAGEDKRWVWAKAEIRDGKNVVVSSPDVPKPVAVRYGWADYPLGNLWNKEGLPATPFRTDNFPLTTGPKAAISSARP